MTKLINCKALSISCLLAFTNVTHASSFNDLNKLSIIKDNYIVLASPVKFDKLDPILPVNAHTKFTLPLVFESLTAVNAQQELQPVLAKSWQISPDKKSVTITIKSGHHFSDNTEVIAIDVMNALNRLCSRGSHEYGELRGLVGCAEHVKNDKAKPSISVIDKYTIRFNITSSPTTFLYELSSPSAVIAKPTKTGLIGSAPYIERENKADYLILDKNQFYSGELSTKNMGIVMFYAGGPNLFKIIDHYKPDGALMYRMEALNNFKDNNYKLIKSNPNITEILVLNNQKFPFSNPLVRQALSHEVYNNFSYACMNGAHKPYGIIPNGIGGSLMSAQPPSLPEVSAQELFNKVPQLKNRTVSVTIHQLLDLKNNCESEQLKLAAKKYNIDIKFSYHKDYSDLLPLYLNHNLDGFLELYIFKNREAYKIFEFFAKSGENDANIKENDIDDMLREAIAMPSSHSRFQVYKKLAQFMQDNHIIIPIFYMDHGNLMNKCLTGISDDFFFNPFIHLSQIAKTTNCQSK